MKTLADEPSVAGRYREIAATVARHGLGMIGEALGFGGTHDESKNGKPSKPEHLREALEELGTTFIKVGQALSTRGDLLPPDYRAELSKLQDSVEPLPSAVIFAEAERELGAPLGDFFSRVETRPLASASISQVHRARLIDGSDVILKVRKPGIEAVVETDLKILSSLAEEASKRVPDLQPYDLPALVQELSDSLRAELDLSQEAQNIGRFSELFERDRGIRIPFVYEDYSTERLLVLDLLDGVKPSEAQRLPKRARAAAAKRVARFVFESALDDGILYADPHQGNFLIRGDGALSIVDFGMVRRFGDSTRRKTASMFVALGHGDIERLADHLIDLASPSRPVDRRALTRDLERVVQPYLASRLDAHRSSEVIAGLLEVVRGHRLQLPAIVAVFFKALAMGEGVVAELDADVTVLQLLGDSIDKLTLRDLRPDRMLERSNESAVDAADLAAQLPRRIDRILGALERGNARIWTRFEGLETTLDRIERFVNRLAAALLVAAVIVALAIIAAAVRSTTLVQMAGGLLVAGSIVCALFVLWFALHFARRR